MLNLNLNIIGGALKGTRPGFEGLDSRLFYKFFENFYTASLKANAALEIVASGSDSYFGPRYYKTVVSSSSTPSIESGSVLVASGTYLIEQDSSVTASLKGFPDNWNVVQFGSASIFSNVTMSLDIPEAGISLEQYETGSLITASFVSDPKGIYNINATIIINPYYTSTIVENFNIPSSSIVNQLVTGSASGFLIEDSFITSTSGSVLNQVSAKESGSVDAKLKGVNTWNIVPTVFTSPSSSVSLVTMSMEIPVHDVDVRAYTTSSIISASIGNTSPYLEDNGTTDVNNIVNVKNAFIPIDYLIVGGGNKGTNYGGNLGGGGGFATQGNFIVKLNNKSSIVAEIGRWGRLIVDFPSGPAATSSSLYYVDSSESSVKVSAAGAASNDAVQGCSTTSQVGAFLSPWLDGQFYGGRGADTTTGTGCQPVTSSIVPFNAGRGGNLTLNFGDTFGPNNGVVAFRYYDPNNSFSASLTSGTAVTYASGGYKFVYLTDTGSLNRLTFNLTDQEYIVPIDNLPGTEAYISSSYTQSYFDDNLVQDTLLTIAVTGSGYSKIPVNREFEVSGSTTQNTNITMDETSEVNVTFEGFSDWTPIDTGSYPQIEYLLVGGGFAGGKTGGSIGGGGGDGGYVYTGSIPIVYNIANVTMSLEIPDISYSASSNTTQSLFTASFIANKATTYDITASVNINSSILNANIIIGAGQPRTEVDNENRFNVYQLFDLPESFVSSSITITTPLYPISFLTSTSGSSYGFGAWATERTFPANGRNATGSFTWVNGQQYAGGGGAGATSDSGIVIYTASFGGGEGGSNNGIVNTGGGGGGSSWPNGAGTPGGNGASGTVVLRYFDPSGSYQSTGGVRTVTGSYVYHTFTTNGPFQMVIPPSPFY